MKPTHAGAVVYRIAQNQVLFLVVSSSTGAHWVLPRGHIEPGEAPDAAALRELREEAGVIGEIIARLNLQCFQKQAESVVARYFLIKAVADTPALESRKTRWLERAAALALLSFDEGRRALDDGAARIPASDRPD